MSVAREGDLISYVHPITGNPYTQEIPSYICSSDVKVNNKKTCVNPFLFTVEDKITGSGTLTFSCTSIKSVIVNSKFISKVGDQVSVLHSSSTIPTTGNITTGSLDVI